VSLAPAVAPDLPLSPPLAGALLPDEPALAVAFELAPEFAFELALTVAFELAPEFVFELALEVAAALLEELLEELELVDWPPPAAF